MQSFINRIREAFSHTNVRVLVIVFLCFDGVIIFNLITNYNTILNHHKEAAFTKLSSVVNTLAPQIDGDRHQYIFDTNPTTEDIPTNTSNASYFKIHQELKKSKLKNQLESEIYTMVWNEDSKHFEFGVSSSETPYFRHQHPRFPDKLLKNYETGGNLDIYKDANGEWLSSFYPIRNNKGDVVAILEADIKANQFFEKAISEIAMHSIFSLGIMLIVGFIMMRQVRNILRKETLMIKSIKAKSDLLEIKNKDIIDSINYAQSIQKAVFPSLYKIEKHFPESFVYYEPKDIVSGDFYWQTHIKDKVLLAVADCTGHGVPGAFMSLISKIKLDEAVFKKELTNPAEILNELDHLITEALFNEGLDKQIRDGMDIALISIDKAEMKLEYAGAFRPLKLIRNKEIIDFKGTPESIGGEKVENKNFECHCIDLQKGDSLYLFSDGYPDQFGGPKNKKFMMGRFNKLLLSVQDLPMKDQCPKLKETFNNWKGNSEQIDDVMVMGIRL